MLVLHNKISLLEQINFFLLYKLKNSYLKKINIFFLDKLHTGNVLYFKFLQ